ncbi:hypothetical protein J7T55_009205 [Diaporthe amygdali]|uniref:uncharacterized protein n=1 Tax=Phomopsis amygdali TaxID=1214568 RepID=UPI0022FE7126|nr:uncharacterized protein J7T55_009205 [Diaporthe amygdali]KAJ0118422.1 hypothetical protein J7T55_009205 [Diaporthe amygdali]
MTYIRLATLEPATQPQDNLVIRLDTVPFKAPFSDSDYNDPNLTVWHDVRAIRGDDPPPPKYEALSYAWGSEEDPARVYVRGRSHKHDSHSYYLSITRNLHDALRALRKYHLAAENPEGTLASSLSRVLWIDAICIDQANAAEKGPQVAMMGSIYQSASRVVAWLGPADETSPRAMHFMCSVGLQVNVSFRGSELSPVPGAADPTLGDIQAPLFETHDHNMVQEVLLGNPLRTVVLCGPQDAVPWSLFRKAIAVLRTYVTVQDNTAYLSRLRYDFGALACKDPRDRIYAVLNLLGPLERRHLRIRPDYEMPAAKVYRELVRRMIGVLGDLTILEECEANAEGDRSLPSWVPNWACQSAFRVSKEGASFASAQLAGWTASNDILDDSSDILTLAGVSVSTIQHIGTDYPDNIDAGYETRVAQMLLQKGLWDPNRPWDVPLCEWVRTFLTGGVAEAMSSPPQWAPTMADGIETLRVMLAAATNTPYKGTSDRAKWSSSMSVRFLKNAGDRIAGRRMCKDSRGSLVLAPPLVRPGDLVCVLLGSDNHVLLRPTSSSGEQFRLVGTCFAHCALYGTAFLGPLPPGIRIICNPRTSNMTFISIETGQRSLVDPRLSYLFSEEKLAEFEKALSENGDSPVTLKEQIDPEVLSKCGRGLDGRKGVDMRKFEII